jgi:hypothetical protein
METAKSCLSGSLPDSGEWNISLVNLIINRSPELIVVVHSLSPDTLRHVLEVTPKNSDKEREVKNLGAEHGSVDVEESIALKRTDCLVPRAIVGNTATIQRSESWNPFGNLRDWDPAAAVGSDEFISLKVEL